MSATDYASDHDGVLPFAPVMDLDRLRGEVASACATTMRYAKGSLLREERIEEATALGQYHGELLSAAIWRAHAEEAAR